jgi:hypothetical protein
MSNFLLNYEIKYFETVGTSYPQLTNISKIYVLRLKGTLKNNQNDKSIIFHTMHEFANAFSEDSHTFMCECIRGGIDCALIQKHSFYELDIIFYDKSHAAKFRMIIE